MTLWKYFQMFLYHAYNWIYWDADSANSFSYIFYSVENGYIIITSSDYIKFTNNSPISLCYYCVSFIWITKFKPTFPDKLTHWERYVVQPHFKQALLTEEKVKSSNKCTCCIMILKINVLSPMKEFTLIVHQPPENDDEQTPLRKISRLQKSNSAGLDLNRGEALLWKKILLPSLWFSMDFVLWRKILKGN